MTEIWKPVVGYEKYYEVSNLGRVRSNRTGKVLKYNVTPNGRATVELFGDVGTKSKRLLVHRLAAIAFIPNPNNYPQINHKDENPSNNCVENLEWCTAKYNMNYGTRLARQLAHIDYSDPKRKKIARENGKKACKPVLQFTKCGEYIAQHESIRAAAKESGVRDTKICDVLRGRAPSAGGFKWKYVKEDY